MSSSASVSSTSASSASASSLSQLCELSKWFTLLDNTMKLVFVIAALTPALNAVDPAITPAQVQRYIADVNLEYDQRILNGVITEGEITFAEFLMFYTFTEETILGCCLYRPYNNATLLAGDNASGLREFALYHLVLTVVLISRINMLNSCDDDDDDFYRGIAIDSAATMSSIVQSIVKNAKFAATTSTSQSLEIATEFARANIHSAVIHIYGDISQFSVRMSRYSAIVAEQEYTCPANMVQFKAKTSQLHGVHTVVLTKPKLSPTFFKYLSDLQEHCATQILAVWCEHVRDHLFSDSLAIVMRALGVLVEKLGLILSSAEPLETARANFMRNLTASLNVGYTITELIEFLASLESALKGIETEYGNQFAEIGALNTIGEVIIEFAELMDPPTNMLRCIESIPVSVDMVTDLTKKATSLELQMRRKQFMAYIAIAQRQLIRQGSVNLLSSFELDNSGYSYGSYTLLCVNASCSANGMVISMIAKNHELSSDGTLPEDSYVINIKELLSMSFNGVLTQHSGLVLSATVCTFSKKDVVISAIATDGDDIEHIFNVTSSGDANKIEINFSEIAAIKKITFTATEMGRRVVCVLADVALNVSF